MSSRVFMATRLVIITKLANFSAQAKTALESDHQFDVLTFDLAAAALAYIRQHPQAAVLLDTRVDDMPYQQFIDQLQAVQPDIAIIAAPDTPAVRDLYRSHNIQAVIDLPMKLRRLMGIITDSVNEMYEAQPATQPAPDTRSFDPGMMLNYHQTLEFWVSSDDTGELLVESTRSFGPSDVKPPDESEIKQATDLFEKLAAEEPPLPSTKQGGTISDLQRHLLDPEQDESFEEDETQDQPGSVETGGMTLAQVVLEAMRDQEAAVSLDNFRERAERVRSDNVSQAAPVQAPPMELPQFTGPLEYTAPTTVPHENQDTKLDPSDWRTDPIEPVRRSRPADTAAPPPETARPKPPPPPEIERIKPPSQPLPELESKSAPLQMPYTEFDEADPDVAQMALTLTQTSLELTAEASLLTRAGQIMAYAGKLPPEDIAHMGEILDGEWDSADQKARIRFFRVVETGQDYMLYSRQLDEGYTLSLIFAGTMPVRNIRRQAQRLADALENVPAPPPPTLASPVTDGLRPVVPEAEEEIVVAEVEAREPMTFVLVLDHAAEDLSDDVRSHAQRHIAHQIAARGWDAHELLLEPYFCYVYADVPANIALDELQSQLRQAATSAVTEQARADAVWDDSYLVLQPGRALEPHEVDRFVEFARR